MQEASSGVGIKEVGFQGAVVQDRGPEMGGGRLLGQHRVGRCRHGVVGTCLQPYARVLKGADHIVSGIGQVFLKDPPVGRGADSQAVVFVQAEIPGHTAVRPADEAHLFIEVLP